MVLETQILILREEQARTKECDQRIEEAKKALEECQKSRDASVTRQAALTATIAMFQDMSAIAAGEETQAVDLGTADSLSKSAPARIGKQHYRLLHTIRRIGHVHLEELASSSHVAPRRAKSSMSDDVAKKYVGFDGHGYYLTALGLDYLKRFEDYRTANNIGLPPLVPVSGEDEGEEPEAEHQVELTVTPPGSTTIIPNTVYRHKGPDGESDFVLLETEE
jgi:hypothetical protein